MYCEFFQLKERPFNVTADPNFFYLSKSHREAYSHLLYGINERKGILEITGEVGTGKTTLCRAFLNELERKTKTAFIINPLLSDLQLLQAVILDFGIRIKRFSRLEIIWELNKFLLKERKEGSNVVLIIDEAQNLKPKQLEQIRLLSNLETEKEKLLQIVLVGQPELKKKLELPELRQIRQRIMVFYHIQPLERYEINDYVYHRLKVAGDAGSIIFEEDTMDEIYNFSKGIPRLVNVVCDRALLLGFVQQTYKITKEILNRCIEELISNQ